MAFFGANASGKTNLLKAFHVLRKLVLGDSRLSSDLDALAVLFEPNRLNPKFSETTFALEFLLDGDCFTYRLSYSASAIKEEALLKNGEAIFTILNLEPEFAPKILSASYSKKKLSEILHVECSDGQGRQTKSFLRCIGRAYPGLHSDLKKAFDFFKDKLKITLSLGSLRLPDASMILASALGVDRGEALRRITEVIRRLDIDIEALDISRREPASNGPMESLFSAYHWEITSTHKDIAGNPIQFDFANHESAGTQRLAGLVGRILSILETGGVFLVDELECSLHPLLMREIVLLFKKRRYNPKGAQLIFTTHNTDILDDSILRLSEIALVRKNIANGTLVRRLVDLKKEGESIRNVTNFRNQYLAGFYSGVPHPAL